MTTRITVDAHAGWPVEVIQRARNQAPGKDSQRTVVPPNTKQDFNIWDTNELIIRELEHPSVTDSGNR